VCTPGPDVSYVSTASSSHQGSKVLVVGSTGGVGQLVVAKLLEAGYVVRATSRNPESARALFGANDDLELCTADLRDAAALTASGICDGIDAVVSCTGTTAFPSARWKDGNGPENTDFVGTSNLVNAVKTQSPSCKVRSLNIPSLNYNRHTPNTRASPPRHPHAPHRPRPKPTQLQRFVLVSSIGVERTDQMPFLILNLFGVLKFKRKGEQTLMTSGLPYTVLRPGRLTDGPYTSYDVNTVSFFLFPYGQLV